MTKSRVLFNSQSPQWSQCMDTCPKYSGAKAPSFTDRAQLDELIVWALNTTTDPASFTLYEDAIGRSFWIPFRFELLHTYLFRFIYGECFIATLRRRDIGKVTTLAKRWTPALEWCQAALT